MLPKVRGTAWIAAAALMALGMAIPAERVEARPSHGVVDRVSGFQVAGRTVRVEAALPKERGRRPAVLVLHGANGISGRHLLFDHVQALADHGFAVFVVHYFDGLAAGNKAHPDLYWQREQVLDAAVEHVRGHERVDPERVAVLGYSLGGFHALGLGTRDRRLRAVVSIGGAMSAHLERSGIDRIAPALILHGERDNVVPVHRVHDLADLLAKVGAMFEYHVYPREAHVFRPSALRDSVDKTVAFLRAHLSN